MAEWLNVVHETYRWLHLAAGMIGLVLFWVVVAAAKGSRFHRISGQTFIGIVVFVAGSGLISSLWGLMDPWSFIGRSLDSIEASRRTAIAEDVRFLLSILLLLSLAVLTGVVFGFRAVHVRENHFAMRWPLLVVLEFLTLMACLGVATFAAWQLFPGNHTGGNGGSGSGRYWIPLVLAVFLGSDIVKDVRYIFGPQPPRGTWVIKHIEAMLGLGIAFYTAFAVFGVRRFLPFELAGLWNLVPWIAPSLIGIPLIWLTVNRWSQKLGISRENSESLNGLPAQQS